MKPTQCEQIASYFAEHTRCERCWLHGSCWASCSDERTLSMKEIGTYEKYRRELCAERMGCWIRHISKPALSDTEQKFCEWADLFGYEWLARNHDGSLRCFQSLPEREGGRWEENYCYPGEVEVPPVYKFDFIGWEDIYPTYITDLIMKYWLGGENEQN